MLLPLHIVTTISIGTTGMQPLIIRNCLMILVITARELSLRQGSVMLKQLVTLLHLSILDLVTFGGFVTVFLTGGNLPYLLFNGPEVLTTFTDQANLFARNFSYNSTLDDSYQLLPDFPSVLSTGLPPGRSLPEWSHMQSTIKIHVKPLAQTEFHPLSLRWVLQSFLLF